MEDVLHANTQEHGTPFQKDAYPHANKINTGTITSINAHGVLTALLYGMETSVFNAQQELSTLEIDMCV